MEAESVDTTPTPETRQEKVDFIKGLIGEPDEAKPVKKDSEAAPEADDRPDESGDSQDDGEAPLAAESVEDDPEGQAAEDSSEPDTPVNVASLAEHLGIDAADLYELEVPIDGFEGTTLGELKDAYKEHGPIAEARAKIDSDRDDMERQLLRTRSELNAMMQIIPEADRAYLIKQAQSRYKGWEKEQQDAVLEAIPEWSDETKRASDRAEIVKLGLSYGFSEQEITHTQDHRTLRLLRDAARDRKTLRSIDPASKRNPGKPNAPGKSVGNLNKGKRLKAAIAKAKANPTMQGKEGAVSQLIRNQ